MYLIIAYLLTQQKHYLMSSQQAYAPFGSVSQRSKKQKKLKKDDPGPGSYDVSLPIINPVVQTIRKQNNNVIIKLGHLGTPAFQNDEDRFKIRAGSKLGPGSYSPDKEQAEKVQTKSRVRANQKVHAIIKDHIPRRAAISQVRELKMTNYVEMPDPQKARKLDKVNALERVRGAIWSKMTQERGKEQEKRIKSISSMGPADYDPKQAQGRQATSSVFKSQSIRSFFDQIYFETNQEKLAKERQNRKYKSLGVGPGKYNPSQKGHQFHRFQFFGSTAERNLI